MKKNYLKEILFNFLSFLKEFRYLDIQYNRNEEFKSQTDGTSDEESLILDDEKYVENTVIFVPNVWSLMPTNVEYQKQVEAYQSLIEKEPDWVNEPAENDGQAEGGTDSEANLTSNSINADDVKEPTHYTKLDLKKMKVDELRCELAARNLDTKGLKQQLLNRLKDALEAEKAQDGIDVSIDPKEASFLDDALDSSQQSLIMDEDMAKSDPKEDKKPTQPYTWSKLSRTEREKAYRLPVTPHIIVHPSPTFRQNKFECQLVSLSHILDYRREDSKECSFEVFLFAELFHEMLLRDSAFQVYKHLLGLREDPDKASSSGKRKLSEEDSSDAKKSKTDEQGKKTDDQKAEKTLRPKTLHPELLFSFTYIDSHRNNCIHEKDLEDLFYLIGLNLSRSKCKALLKKLNTKDGLINYRTLTDRSVASSALTSFYQMPADQQIVDNIISFDSYLERSAAASQNKDIIQTVVEINGSTIDVLTTVKKLEKCEESLNEIDLKYKEALDELDRVKVLNRTLDRHKQKLVDEASELKKKLRDEQRFSKDSDDKYLRVKDCLYRTRTQLNKVLDDISDSTRRSQKSSDSNGKSAKGELDKKDLDTKRSDDDLKQLNENSQDNSCQDALNDQNKVQEIQNDGDEDAKENSNENEQSQGDMLEQSNKYSQSIENCSSFEITDGWKQKKLNLII
ncbi:p30 dbc [Brachionus plicatilis]|uniref:p30 dbc n=1 Tax=Brachionus plicatilis TaxID=10195 RepID=A0A3M7TAH1_BRAPC|nr:p30 dbc [Brachionus plicatilis]